MSNKLSREGQSLGVRWARRFPLVILVTILVGTGAAVLIGRGGSQTHVQVGSGPDQAGSASLDQAGIALYPLTLPSGYSIPVAIATVPGGTGVWTVAGSKKGTTLFRYDQQTSALKQFPVQCPTGPSPTVGLRAELTVTSGGATVWLGLNQTLAKLTPATGQLTCIALPTRNLGATTLDHQPPMLHGYAEVEGTAVSPDGSTVAVGRAGATSIQLYDTLAGTWTSMALPNAEEASQVGSDVAYLPDGDLLATANNTATHADQLLMSTSKGFVPVDAAGAATTVAARGDLFAAASSTSLSMGSDTGGVAKAATVGLAQSSGLSYIPSGTVGEPAVPLGNGEIAVPSASGIVIVEASTGGSHELSLGTTIAGLPGVLSSPAAVPTTQEVPINAEEVAVDQSGDLWFIPDINNNKIGEIAAGEVG